MEFYGGLIISNFLAILLVIVTVVILSFKRKYKVWDKLKVPVIESPIIPFGNFSPWVLQKISLGELLMNFYKKIKNQKLRYAGVYMFGNPMLIICDADLIKYITTKDFQHFTSRGTYCNEENDPLTGSLLNLNGEKWKNMRSKLTPTFSSGKMKMMFQTLVECSEGLEVVLEDYWKNQQAFDIKDTMGRFTTDIIGSCAFGIDCNSLKDPDSVFRKHGKSLFDRTAWDSIRSFFSSMFPTLFAKLGLKRIPQEENDFFMDLVKNTVEYRETNNFVRKDFMQILIDMKAKNDDERKEKVGTALTMNEIAAQVFLFFLAGFETSSTTLCSVMYELSLNQDVQDKLREEIHEVLKKHDEKITYEGIMDTPYMDKVIDESMRLHPAAPTIVRKCTQDYQVPESDFTIKENTVMFFSIQGLHVDPEHYPDPEKFDPERFSPEEKAKRHPYAFLPFGAGPRNCIGLRFAMMQMKVGLIALLKNYKFTLNSKTKLPITLDARSNLYSIKGSVWLNADKID